MPALNFSSRVSLAAKALMGLFSEDSLNQAHGLLTGVMPGDAGAPPYRGASNILQSYSTMPWLRAVSQRIATAVATSATQWRLYAPASRSSRNLGVIQRSGDCATRSKLLREATDDVVLLDDHILLKSLNRANSLMVGESLFKLTQIHLDLIGESFWVIQRNNFGAPVEFWPIPPDWVQSTPTPSSPSYRVSFRGWQGNIPDTEMLWMADLDPANPYGRGSGIARSLSDELEISEYSAKHTRQTFLNRARPDLLVWPKSSGPHDIGLQPDQVRRLEERWLDQHQGFWKAAKPFFSSREIGVHEVSQSFSELQLTELRAAERDTIIQTFSVPPELIGVLTNSNRSTIDSADYLFSRWVVTPRMEFLRAQLQERLVPEYDDRLILDFESPIAEDREHLLESAKAAPWALTVNEWRGLQGHEPLPDADGNVHMMPLNMIPVPTPNVPPAPIEDVDTDVAEIEMESSPTARVKKGNAIKQDDDLLGLGAGEGLSRLWRELVKWEPGVVRMTDKLLRDLADRVPKDQIVQLRSVPDFERIAKFDGWLDEILESYRKPWFKAFFTGATITGDQFGFTIERGAMAVRKQQQDDQEVFEIAGQLIDDEADEEAQSQLASWLLNPTDNIPFWFMNPKAKEWMQAHGAESITLISESTEEGIREAIAQAIAEGLGYRPAASEVFSFLDSSDAIEDKLMQKIGMTKRQAIAFDKWVKQLDEDEPNLTQHERLTRMTRRRKRMLLSRARTIARTEMARAAIAGQKAIIQETVKLGLIQKEGLMKEWITTLDPCDLCASLADKGMVAFDKSFDGYDSPWDAHPNCRCMIAYTHGDEETPSMRAGRYGVHK